MIPGWSEEDDDRRWITPNASAPLQSAQPRPLRPFNELRNMTHDGQVFSVEQHTNLYFHYVKVINDLVESFQMYATHMYYHPDSTAKYKPRQSEQAANYKIIRYIDVVQQIDQVAHIH